MPSFNDALERLGNECENISNYALAQGRHRRPVGPFTSAYLYLDPDTGAKTSLWGLIRDGDESEKRAYGAFSGPSDPGPSSSSSHKVTRAYRTPATWDQPAANTHVLTPLRNLQRKRGTADELDATLEAADSVVQSLLESKWHMSRAKNQVRTMQDQHRRQVARIAELNRLIDEAKRPAADSRPSREPEPEPEQDQAESSARKPLSVDEAIKAEEQALKDLEASLAPLRRSAALSASAARSPAPAAPPVPAKSPARVLNSPAGHQPRTPARTPRTALTNSILRPAVSATPRRLTVPTPTINRFSPLNLLTPRAPAPSATRPRNLFGSVLRSSTSETTTPRPAVGASVPPTVQNTPITAATPSAPGPVLSPQPTPVPAREAVPDPTPTRPAIADAQPPTTVPVPAAPSEGASTQTVEGVNVDLPIISQATDKIWETFTDLMRMEAAEPVAHTPTATVVHLHNLSRATVNPPSPSSSSALTATSAAEPAVPVTPEAILLAHLTLQLLRNASASDAGDLGVPSATLKESLATVARVRGWDQSLATKTIYAAVGKRAVRIDKRAGRKVSFLL